MSEKEKMISGQWYSPEDDFLKNDRKKVKALCQRYNLLFPEQTYEKRNLLSEILADAGNESVVEPCFFCDYGYNIFFNGFVYVNHNSVFLDCAKIEIGDNTYIGPNCGFYTAIHPIEASERVRGLECAKPIKIGEKVWIGGNVTVLPGVTIGDRAVIGAGSVVTKDIPSDVVAVGNPCRVVKNI